MWPKKRSLLLVNFGLDNGSRGTGDQQQVPKLTPDGKIVGQNTRTKAASYKMAKKKTRSKYMLGLLRLKHTWYCLYSYDPIFHVLDHYYIILRNWQN